MNKRLEYIKAHIGKDKFEGPSQLGNWLHGRIVKAEEGSLTVSYQVRKEMTNPVGMLHGGTICAMLDEVIGITTYTLDITHFYPSVNLNVDYLSTAREGDEVLVTTELIRKGRNVIHMEGKVHNAEGKLLAKATSNLIKSTIEI
ncbi:PaaI family thioesterase [Algivirga pacifica]|uniref:Thioesterase domain-containing protein n=1 Tax=Algivirga pacifica TaxID=1162670 RepID=A0ABP9CYE7_9BACT